jgi:hypothetical protein
MQNTWPLVFGIAMASLLPALAATANGETTRVVPPPSLTKVEQYLVMEPLPDGRLIGLFVRTGANGPEAAACYSNDGGCTWGEAETLCSLPKDLGGWGLHNALVDTQGELHLIFTNDAHTAGKGLYEMRFDVYHVGSTHGRTQWTAPTLVRKGYYGSLLSVIQLKSGRLILPVCYLTPRVWSNRGKGFDAFSDMGRFSSGVVYSDDAGGSWHQADREFKVPSPYIGADGMIEPIALQLKDGRVWLLIRTQLGRFFESFSADGSVWSPPRPSAILSSDSPPSLTRLKDGRIVMLWNNSLRFCYAQGGRHVLHGAISEDEGRTWQGYREVAWNPEAGEPPPPNGDHGVSYTVPALTRDGEIITPVSLGGSAGIGLVRLQPAWLCEKSRACDFSSGLDGWAHFGTRGVERVAEPLTASGYALQLRKTDPDWPAAVVWNFPNGLTGQVTLELKLNAGFLGARIGLTDHFSVPFEPEDARYNLFNLSLGPGGKVSERGRNIRPGVWHRLTFDWDCRKAQCRVILDGQRLDTQPMQRATCGVNYLRVCSTADDTDPAGLLIQSVAAQLQ